MSSQQSRADIDARATRLKEIFFAEESRLLVSEYQREFSLKKRTTRGFLGGLSRSECSRNIRRHGASAQFAT